jgi:hypothetical protein
MALSAAMIALCITAVPSTAHAQASTVSAQTTTPAAKGTAWIDVNFFGLSSSQNAQAYVWQEPLFLETLTLATAYPAMPTAIGLGVSGGYQFGSGVGFGVFWNRARYEYTTGLHLEVPHPLRFNAYGSDTDVTAETQTRKDNAVDLSLTFSPRTPQAWQVRLFGGPTYFSVSQDMVSDIHGTQDYGVFTSLNIITITTYDAETVTGSGWGYHVGGDVAYFFSRHVGVGGVLRFNGGSVTVREPLSETSVKLKMGGPMFGAGVRFRF